MFIMLTRDKRVHSTGTPRRKDRNCLYTGHNPPPPKIVHKLCCVCVCKYLLLCPAPNRRGHYAMMLSDVCLSVCLSVCLTSVTYIGPKSRTEEPRKTEIGTQVAHVTRDSDTTFKVKGQGHRGGAYCGGLPPTALLICTEKLNAVGLIQG